MPVQKKKIDPNSILYRHRRYLKQLEQKKNENKDVENENKEKENEKFKKIRAQAEN